MSNHNQDCGAQIDQLAGGYREAQVLFTANRLGIFTLLAKGPRKINEMARALEAGERGLQILCDALVALSLLEKKEDRYENSRAAFECLLDSSPTPKAAILLHGARLYERWGRLYDVVKTGHPASEEELDPRLRFDEQDFARAMANSAGPMLEKTADALNLEGVRRLLDVGGGPGLYAIEFARRTPSLQAVILDNERTLQVARQNIEAAGLSDRVAGLPGDVFTADLAGPYDFIFLSNLIHSYSSTDNSWIVRKCAQALNQSGTLCVKDFLLGPDRTEPLGAALFAVNMLVNTERGNCYTLVEVQEWFSSAGLVFEYERKLTPQSALVVGKKE